MWPLLLLAGGSVFALQDWASSDTESAGLSAEQLLQYQNMQMLAAEATATAATVEAQQKKEWYKEPAVIILGGAALVALLVGGRIYKK